MGFSTSLEELFSFIYKASFDNGLTEHELDHVFLGYYEDNPLPNKAEVESWKWMDLEKIKNAIKDDPQDFTAWFKIIFKRFYNHIKTQNESNCK
jgi:isopentenyl-diphosphate delta-isomerase